MSGGFWDLIRQRDFKLLLAGLAASAAGNTLYTVALVVLIVEQTHSSAWVAAATLVRLAPFVLFGTVAGSLGDRVDRRHLMVAADATRAILMFGLAADALFGLHPVLALVLAFLSGTAAATYLPALEALLPSMVKEDQLGPANAILGVIDNVALILGPALGALLLLLGPPVTDFAANGFCFVFSAATVLLIRTPAQAPLAPQHVRPDWDLGRRLRVMLDPGVGPSFVWIQLVTGFVYGVEAVLLVAASALLLNTGTDGFGWLLVAVGVGGILATGLSSRLAARQRPVLLPILLTVAVGMPLAILALVRSAFLAYGLMALDGAFTVVLDVLVVTALQKAVPADRMGRVFGVMDSYYTVGILAGSLSAPFLQNRFGLRAALIVGGLAVPLLSAAVLPLIHGLEGWTGHHLRVPTLMRPALHPAASHAHGRLAHSRRHAGRRAHPAHVHQVHIPAPAA